MGNRKSSEPFFAVENDLPISTDVLCLVREAVEAAGCDPAQFGSHSMRCYGFASSVWESRC